MSSSIEEKVIDIIAKQAMVDTQDIQMESTLNELGLDSIGFFEFVLAVEDAFNIEINYEDSELNDFDLSNNVLSVVEVIKGLLSQEKAT